MVTGLAVGEAHSKVAARSKRRACPRALMSKKLASSLFVLALASVCGLAQADNVSFSGFSHGSQPSRRR